MVNVCVISLKQLLYGSEVAAAETSALFLVSDHLEVVVVAAERP